MEPFNNEAIISELSIFRIGEVISISGREVKIAVDKEKNLPHIFFYGQLIKNVSVGSYLKILNGFDMLIAKIETEFINQDNSQEAVNYEEQGHHIKRVLCTSLIGYMTTSGFVKGVKTLPLVGNEAYILNTKEFSSIHRFVQNDDELTIRLGTLSTDSQIIVSLGVQNLFSNHVGIFGNTGSGKSYTLAQIYHRLFELFRGNDNFKANSRFLFIDFNGEYSGDSVMTEGKKVYKLSTYTPINKIPMSQDSVMDLDTLCIFASATEKTQRPFISRALNLYHWLRDKGGNKDEMQNIFRAMLCKNIKAIFTMEDKSKVEPLLEYIVSIVPPKYDVDGFGVDLRKSVSYHETHKYYYLPGDRESAYKRKLSDRDLEGNKNGEFVERTHYYTQALEYQIPDDFIRFFIDILYLQLVQDVKNSRAQNDHIHPAIEKLKSMVRNISMVLDFKEDVDFWDKSNIVVVDLRMANQDTKKMIPLLLCHSAYKQHTQNKDKATPYLNIVIDEAHNILSYQSTRESESWKDYRLEVFEEIIKEGRKFGVFMTIASQRPSDISSTIVSQLHNYFIHRLVNDEDLTKVAKTISYLDRISQESLPILPTGSCVVAGQVVEMPLIIQIDKMNDRHKPDNETLKLLDYWKA